MMSEKFKEGERKAEDFKKERLSREMRIEQLPPRLRDKAREKVALEKLSKEEAAKYEGDF